MRVDFSARAACSTIETPKLRTQHNTSLDTLEFFGDLISICGQATEMTHFQGPAGTTSGWFNAHGPHDRTLTAGSDCIYLRSRGRQLLSC